MSWLSPMDSLSVEAIAARPNNPPSHPVWLHEEFSKGSVILYWLLGRLFNSVNRSIEALGHKQRM